MPLSAAYTEASLELWMHTVLGGVADMLGFVVGGAHYQHAVNDALRLYGLSEDQTIADATDVAQLEAAAAFAAWDMAARSATLLYDTGVGGQSRSRNQMREAIRQERVRAAAAMLTAGVGLGVAATPITRGADAYVAREITW